VFSSRPQPDRLADAVRDELDDRPFAKLAAQPYYRLHCTRIGESFDLVWRLEEGLYRTRGWS